LERFLDRLREQNEAGNISGIMIVSIDETHNRYHAQRSGYLSRDRRVEDVRRLTELAKRDPNFSRTIRRGHHQRPISELPRNWTARTLFRFELGREHAAIDAFFALVYTADGGTSAIGRSGASPCNVLFALEALEAVAWGEDNLVGNSGYLSYDHMFMPSPESDAYAREMGDKLSAPACTSCGELMRLVRIPNTFACKPCESICIVPVF
jgi:hypothetical protein